MGGLPTGGISGNSDALLPPSFLVAALARDDSIATNSRPTASAIRQPNTSSLPAEPPPDFHQDLPQHVPPRPVAAVAPVVVALGVLDELRVAGRQQQRAKCL